MPEKETLKIGQGKPGPGRPKGVPNKANGLLRDHILQALNGSHPDGAVGFLMQQARDNPTAFLGLVGKVLPMQIGGDPESPIRHVIERIIVDPAPRD